MNKNIICFITIVCLTLPLMAGADFNSLEKISMINLIANPSKYSNKVVEVYGYYKHIEGFEGGNYLFLTKEYSHINDKSNAIVLPNDVKNPDGSRPSPELYIKIVGLLADYDSKQNYLKEIQVKEIYAVVGFVISDATEAKTPHEESKKRQ